MGLSWEPIRRGEVYCSPACGGHCTYSAFKRAHANANALKRRLGKGWKIHVWENLGWHWEVTNEALRVNQARDGSYWCMLEPHYTLFGLPQSAPTPELAIRKTVTMAVKAMDEIVNLRTSVLRTANKFLSGRKAPDGKPSKSANRHARKGSLSAGNNPNSQCA